MTKDLRAAIAAFFRDGTELSKAMIKELETEIRTHRHHYYNGDAKLTDAQFDQMEDLLKKVKPNSPVLKEVGAAAVGADVKLPYPILSLDKLRPSNFDQWSAKNPGPYVVMDKLDGFAMESVSNGKKWEIFTRGDGHYGKDRSYLAPYVLPEARDVGTCAVRSEALVSKTRFQKIAKDAAAYGSKKPFENERSAVGSVVNRAAKSVNVNLAKALDVVSFEVLDKTSVWAPSKQLQWLSKMGFKTPWYERHEELDSTQLAELLKRRKARGPYLVDGLVVIRDRPYMRSNLTNPVYAKAFKEDQGAQDSVVATVDHIEWRPSSHGKIVPRIHLVPIRVGGVTVKHATGFNAKLIKDTKLGPGAQVQLIRSGDVIPYIQQVVKGTKWVPPDMPFKWTDSGVDLYVDTDADDHKGSQADADMQVRRLSRFFTHLGFDALRIGTLNGLYNAGLNTPKKILTATTQQLMRVPAVKDQKAMALKKAINEGLARPYSWAQFGSATGLFGPGLAETKLAEIEAVYPDWERFAEFTPAKIKALIADLPGFQETTAAKFAAGIAKVLKVKSQLPLKIEAPKKKVVKKGKLTGTAVVFTGFRSKEMTLQIEALGGTEVNSVGKATIVVAADPEKRTGKIKEAEVKGIPIMTPDQFVSKYL